MRRLFLSMVLLAGIAYIGRQYRKEIVRLFSIPSRAVSRAEKPIAGAGLRTNLEIFNGCGMEGDARSLRIQALDRLKNRYAASGPADIDSRITLEAILAPGNDISRWKVKEG